MGMAKEMRLSELAPGISARVTGVEGEKDLRRRVLDMGLVPGTEVQVQRRAPLGDPVSVVFRGYELSLRLAEAQIVLVRPLDCGDCCGKCLA